MKRNGGAGQVHHLYSIYSIDFFLPIGSLMAEAAALFKRFKNCSSLTRIVPEKSMQHFWFYFTASKFEMIWWDYKT